MGCLRATYKRLKTCLSRATSTTHLSLLICGAGAAQHARVCGNMAEGRVHKCKWTRLPREVALIMLRSFDVECFPSFSCVRMYHGACRQIQKF